MVWLLSFRDDGREPPKRGPAECTQSNFPTRACKARSRKIDRGKFHNQSPKRAITGYSRREPSTHLHEKLPKKLSVYAGSLQAAIYEASTFLVVFVSVGND